MKLIICSNETDLPRLTHNSTQNQCSSTLGHFMVMATDKFAKDFPIFFSTNSQQQRSTESPTGTFVTRVKTKINSSMIQSSVIYRQNVVNPQNTNAFDENVRVINFFLQIRINIVKPRPLFMDPKLGRLRTVVVCFLVLHPLEMYVSSILLQELQLCTMCFGVLFSCCIVFASCLLSNLCITFA